MNRTSSTTHGKRTPDRARAHAETRPSPTTHATPASRRDRKSTRLNSSHVKISYAVFCLKKKYATHGTRPPAPAGHRADAPPSSAASSTALGTGASSGTCYVPETPTGMSVRGDGAELVKV